MEYLEKLDADELAFCGERDTMIFGIDEAFLKTVFDEERKIENESLITNPRGVSWKIDPIKIRRKVKKEIWIVNPDLKRKVENFNEVLQSPSNLVDSKSISEETMDDCRGCLKDTKRGYDNVVEEKNMVSDCDTKVAMDVSESTQYLCEKCGEEVLVKESLKDNGSSLKTEEAPNSDEDMKNCFSCNKKDISYRNIIGTLDNKTVN